MSFKFRPSKMSRNVSRHSGVSCDACGKGSFSGKRYKCLVCYDFDLCAECYETGETGTGRHATTHPMQCILTRVDTDLFFGGENHSSEQTTSFTCPLCGQVGFSEAGLREHVIKHSDPSMLQEVICPVCAAHPSGDPNHLTDDLPAHLSMEHRAFRDMEQDPTVVQSRVRRLIGRRRAGLDRYASILSREPSQPHDYDPITELLSQLSSDRAAGGGAAARRVPADVPPHIQQLLEQQDRQQALERASPMRRPICRRMLVPQGSEPGEGSGNVYIIPGGSMFSSHPSKLDPSEVPRGYLVESSGREGRTERGAEISKDPKCLLSNYSLPQLSEEEQEKLEGERADKSLFVQDLLLSTLAYSSESSSNETSDKEDT